jgi:hypothetical protein
MIVVLSKRAHRAMENIEVRWQGHVRTTIILLETDPCTDMILEGPPRAQIQSIPVEATRGWVPVVNRIKFVDPDSAKETKDKKQIGPYRIFYCIDRTVVFIAAIDDKGVDPYYPQYLEAMLDDYKEYKKCNRKKKQNRKTKQKGK